MMKLAEFPKLPQTTTDLVVLLFAFTAASFLWGIIIMGYQERKAPPEFKEIGLFLGGGVLGAIGAKNLSS
ncbi:hypothetical protein Q5692_35735 [Microcoleus sp. C2C3]|uniref:hypothetical protein n=1 Tax=unclassified Microcoleus TaxID=2642155 RepID=UPI002FD41B58